MRDFRKWYAVIVLLVSLLAAAGSAKGQGLLAHSSDDRIFLRWERSSQEQAFHVYRKAPGGNYARVNREEIRPLRHRIDVVRILGEDTGRYMEIFNVQFPEQIHEILDSDPAKDLLAGTIEPRIAVLRGDGFIDDSVAKGTEYTYKVTLMPQAGAKEVVYAEDIALTAHSIPPQQPKNLSAEGSNYAIRIFLEEPEGIGQGIGGHHAGFDILRSETQEGPYQKVNKTRVFVVRSEAEKKRELPVYTDKDVEVGRRYWYKAVSVGILGTQSEPIGPVSAVAYDKTPPSPPTIKNISDDPKGYLAIRWEQENMKDVTGFRVYRSEGIASFGVRITGEFLLDKGERIFQDRTGWKGVMYWYRVAAVDNHGNEAYSAPRKGMR